MRRVLLLAALPLALRAQSTPWTVKVDPGSRDTVSHVTMPPGWHITTGPGALVYDTGNTADGRYALSLEVHLFPEPSREGYGIFLGGRDVSTAGASYVAVLMRSDGALQVVRVAGSRHQPILDWTPTTAIKPHPGTDDTALNILSVRVDPDSVRIDANGSRVAAVARGDLVLDGTFGIRAGAGINLHVTNYDVTRRLAPAPRRRPASN
ncbi:MAG: hypothetical protein IPK85_13155 [Gemmatimonadetes bacterium]|nr:hypothetical protein [Gemmatimonadota bacterium]